MDFSWSEMLLVGIVALIVIGPKDLPGMFRELGRVTAKIRAMGREFSRAMDQAAKESGVKDVTDGLKAVSNPAATGLNAVKSAADRFEKWDPLKPAAAAVAPLTPPAMPASPVAAAAASSVGPATAALAEGVAAKRAASVEKVASLKAAKAAGPAAAPIEAAAPEATAPKRAGRVRKKPDASAGDP
ncbi:MAG: Sec-independent protein translocase protein TatB [Albidovulum sp.]